MKKLKKEVKGITLIALVVTIIVLLILAGIAINLTIGNNGLFTRAQSATKTHKYNSDMEMINMALSVSEFDDLTGQNPEGRDVFLEELRKTDENAEVNYSNIEKVIVYYNKDYYEVDPFTMKVSKHEIEYVARIDNTKYKTIQEAFDAVPKNNTETEVVLIKDITEYQLGNLEKDKKVIMKMEKFESMIDIENHGTLKIQNGALIGDRYSGGGVIENDGNLSIENMDELNRYLITNNGTINIQNVKKGYGSLTNSGTANIIGFESSYENSDNSFRNSETMNISDCNINSFEVHNGNKLTIDNSTLKGKSQNGVIINEGVCEVKGNSNIISEYNTFSSGEGIITNRQNAEFIMSSGNITGALPIYNAGIARLRGNLKVEGTRYNYSCIENSETGELYIEDDTYIYKWEGRAVVNYGKIVMNAGKIETNNSGTYDFAIYNNGGSVELGPTAVTIHKNYGIE